MFTIMVVAKSENLQIYYNTFPPIDSSGWLAACAIFDNSETHI